MGGQTCDVCRGLMRCTNFVLDVQEKALTLEYQPSADRSQQDTADSVKPSSPTNKPVSWRALLVDVDPQAHAQLQASLKRIAACKLQAVSNIKQALMVPFYEFLINKKAPTFVEAFQFKKIIS